MLLPAGHRNAQEELAVFLCRILRLPCEVPSCLLPTAERPEQGFGIVGNNAADKQTGGPKFLGGVHARVALVAVRKAAALASASAYSSSAVESATMPPPVP